MANIRDLKTKIRTTKGTLKITSAMKLVSASKLAKSQEALVNSRPYTLELLNTIKTASALCDGYEHAYFKELAQGEEILLVISTDKGLCGGYNSQLASSVKAFLKKRKKNVKTFFIGKKVCDIMASRGNKGKLYKFERTEPSFKEIQHVVKELINFFLSGKACNIFIAYNKFHSAMNFSPSIDRLLPMVFDDSERDTLKKDYPFNFLYNPSSKDILDELIPEAVTTSLWSYLLNALASEHGSRMTAMDSAVSNCKEAIRQQTIKMNKLRQAAITTELIEVVSGAESLKA